MRETDASPALRAALYRAASLIPGVHLLGLVRDHFGRRGLDVAYETRGTAHELIFDPRTAALMGEQDIGPHGRVEDWSVYLASRPASRLPRRSPRPLTPPCVRGGGRIQRTAAGQVQTGAGMSPR